MTAADGQAAGTAPPSAAEMVDVFTDAEIDTALAINPAGYVVADMADADPRILTLTAGLAAVLADFRARHPGRYIELGIAETNSVSLAAGLAACGYLPYIYSMAPFGVIKCAEQLRTDVAYNHLPVRLVGRLSGLAMGFFGTSHHAIEDIATARRTGAVVTVEDHTETGGLGSIVAETAGAHRLTARLAKVALPDTDLEVGVPAALYEHYGLTVDGVVAAAVALTGPPSSP